MLTEGAGSPSLPVAVVATRQRRGGGKLRQLMEQLCGADLFKSRGGKE